MIKIGYSADALIFDFGAGTVRLRPDYDHYQHRVNMDFTDDDATLDGDNSNEEIGDDANQTAVITRMDGSAVASGRAYDEQYHSLDSGQDIEVIEIAGVVVGYLVVGTISPGVTYSIDDTTDTDSDDTLGYSSYSDVACFGPGTLIATSDGEIPVEWLAPGDRVLTRDHGARVLRWIGVLRPSPSELVTNPILWPVTVPRDHFGPGCPNHPLVLSRQHRILVTGAEISYLFGVPEAFAAAGHLLPSTVNRAPPPGTRYYHLLFDEHEVILANGLWTESLLANEGSAQGAQAPNPPPVRPQCSARMILHRWETEVLQTRITQRQTPLECAA